MCQLCVLFKSRIVFHCVDITHLVFYAFVDAVLCCFQFGVVMNKVAENLIEDLYFIALR